MCLDPLDPDPDKNGVKSDHRIVLIRPINIINNKSTRTTREVKVRAFPESGLDSMKEWFIDQTWDQVFEAESADIFQHLRMAGHCSNNSTFSLNCFHSPIKS